MAIARGPTCLLADEPFLGLVPKDAAFLTEIFKQLARDGCAVAITGQEVRSLLRHGGRHSVDDGRNYTCTGHACTGPGT